MLLRHLRGAWRHLRCAGHWPLQPGHGSTAAGGEELFSSRSGSFNAFIKEGKYRTVFKYKTKINFILNNYDVLAVMAVKRAQ